MVLRSTDGTPRILFLVRILSAAALSGVSIMQGREVFKGTWDSESKRLAAKARSASPRFDADARSANLEGYVARDAAGRLHVDGISLEGAHQRLEPGTRVRVRATFSGGGMRWQARAIRSLREGPMIRGLNRNLRAPVSPEAALLLKVAPPHQRPTENPPAATLDPLSGGRHIMGIGVGWLEEEFKALKVPFEKRGAITDESIGAMRDLWSKGPSTHKGDYYEWPAVESNPKPVNGSIPIVICGHSKAAGIHARAGDRRAREARKRSLFEVLGPSSRT